MKTSRCTKAEVTYSKYIDMNINVETDIPTQSGFDVIALRGYFLCIRQQDHLCRPILPKMATRVLV